MSDSISQSDSDPTQPWRIYTGSGIEPQQPVTLPEPPPWRRFAGGPPIKRTPRQDTQAERKLGPDRGATFQASIDEIDMVNAMLRLRRPLLITGKPGTGKSSLAYSVAYELGYGPVLRWAITSRSTLKNGLYDYDAIARLQEASLRSARAGGGELRNAYQERRAGAGAPDIGRFIRLGPLGTALLPAETPRVLLIDELDKSDIDLPNDLLNIFEEGEFTIPELQRLTDQPVVDVLPCDGEDLVSIRSGRVLCRTFPLVFITSNGEREFSGPFLRRCLRLNLAPPGAEKLAQILEAHRFFSPENEAQRQTRDRLIREFLEIRREGDLATDQLMNAVYLLTRSIDFADGEQTVEDKKQKLIKEVLRLLNR